MGFLRLEYWSGKPFPSLGDLPDPGIEPGSPALQADSLPSEPQELSSRLRLVATVLDSTGVEEGLQGLEWKQGGQWRPLCRESWLALDRRLCRSPGGACKDGPVAASPRWHQVWALSRVQQAGHRAARAGFSPDSWCPPLAGSVCWPLFTLTPD